MTKTYYSICELPQGATAYRGIQRTGPVPPTRTSENIDLYEACLKYIQNAERLSSREEAMFLWRSLGGDQSPFEVIRIMPSPQTELQDSLGFLGYDVTDSSAWNSMLCWDWQHGPSWEEARDNLILLRVIFDLFDAQRNVCALFSSLNSARRFVRSLEALTRLSPGTIESPEAESFRIFAVFSETHPVKLGEGMGPQPSPDSSSTSATS